MASFDQRNQQVGIQYNFNAAGNINLGVVQDLAGLSAELRKLADEMNRAVKAGIIDEEKGLYAETNIKKAVLQAEKPMPNKRSILEYLKEAKELIEGVTVLSGMAEALIKAIELVRNFL